MPKCIVIARHGLCNSTITNRQLRSEGKEQMERLAQALAKFICLPLAICSSIARWTIQSAEILANYYNIELAEIPSLFMQNPASDMRDITRLINSAEAETLLLVTHDHAIPAIASHCATACLHQKQHGFPTIWQGESLIFNMQQKKIFRLYYLGGKGELKIADITN